MWFPKSNIYQTKGVLIKCMGSIFSDFLISEGVLSNQPDPDGKGGENAMKLFCTKEDFPDDIINSSDT